MGCFDEICWDCPSCSASRAVKHQSKAGKCNMLSFDGSVVPLVVAADIDNETVNCEKCGARFYINANVPPVVNCTLSRTRKQEVNIEARNIYDHD